MSIRTLRARVMGVVGAVLLVAGVIAIVIAVRAQKSAPQPSAAAGSSVNVIPTAPPADTVPSPASTVPGPASTPRSTPGSGAAAGHKTRGLILPRSTPLQLKIPAINVDSDLKQIGLNSSGEITTPPLVKDSHAYWLNVSPTPGQLGPSTIIGHVDSAAYGPGPFFKLGQMRQRKKIYLTRADGLVAMFEVERVVEYKKNEFPTHEVYGNIDHAGLRLITCGGTFDSSIHSYESNIVVYAALVSSHHA